MIAFIPRRIWNLVLLLLLAGCGAGKTSEVPRPHTQPTIPQKLPSPSELSRLETADPEQRSTSTDFPNDLILNGAEFRSDLVSARVQVDGDLLTFSSGFSPAYAIYSFDQPAPERLPQAHVIWETTPQAGNVFMGIANFQTNRWNWPQVTRGGETMFHDSIEFADWEPYLAPATGKFYVAVVVVGDEFVKLRRLRSGEPYFVPFVMIPSAAIVPIETAVLGACRIEGSETAALEVDFNEDGVADGLTENSRFLYSIPGEKPVTVTSTDEDGMQATMTRTFHALAGNWDYQQLAVPEDAETRNFFPVAGLVDGRVAIAYIHDDFTTQPEETPSRKVQYMIAADESATSWLGPVDVYEESSNRPSEVNGILDIDGKPGIVLRTELGLVYYALGDAVLPASWSDPVTLAGSLTDESGVNVGLAQGHPCLAYTVLAPIVGWSIFFARSDDADGMGNWSGSLVGSGIGDVGLLADGVNPPAAAAHDESETSITIYESPVPSGLSPELWPVFRQVPAGPAFTGSGPMLVPHAENATNRYMLAYRSGASVNLGHLRSTNKEETYLRTLDISADSFFDGIGPVLSFNDAFCAYDFQEEDLYFVGFNMIGDDTTWSLSNTPADSAGNVGKHCSLTQVGNIPLIVYEDADNRSIKLARMI
jgi:hypothetical protein